MMERTYINALKCLNGLQTSTATLEAHRVAGTKLVPNVPEAAKAWLRRIGYATTDLTKLNVIHVAGTKGKGTTCTLVDSILREHHLRYNLPRKIGLFTSPHLMDVRERIRIDSQPISEDDFTKYFFDVYNNLQSTLDHGSGSGSGDMPGYSRFLTLMSYHVFLKEGMDGTIYETGIGGELDVTNIIEKPIVTGITTVSIDHVQTLGPTISDIAWHKGGIIKSDCPAYTSPQDPSVLAVLQDRAREKGTQLKVVDPIQEVFPGAMDEMLQKLNGPLAIALANTYLEHFSESLSRDDVCEGLQNARSLGRLQKISEGRNTWYVDGAYNIDSIKLATKWFATQVRNKSSSTYVLIFNQEAVSRKTLINSLFDMLSQNGIRINHAIFCTNKVFKEGTVKMDFVNNKLSLGEEMKTELQTEYAQAWKKLDPQSTTTVKGTIEEALESVRLLKQETQVLVTGSLHFIGAALTILYK